MRLVATIAAAGMICALGSPAYSGTYNLTIGEKELNIPGATRTGLSINDSVPGPTLRFQEGEDLVINVRNDLDVETSIHWHGLILPSDMDGVPGFGGYPGIPAGTTFTYRFPAQQSGTYWYHSHSGLQEQEGVYGAITIEPAAGEPFSYDREHVVVLSDWHADEASTILSNLKKESDIYNFKQRTLFDFLDDVEKKGVGETLSDRGDWGEMRMMPTDISDVQQYVYLMNGKSADQNWTGLFREGERVRLRFVNAAAMTYYDIRIPGLKMTVVQNDGQNVQPVTVDEFRIAVAETYDVIVTPKDAKAYTIFAETMARDGFARGTLAPREGMSAAVPTNRPAPLLTMADMSGHAGHGGHGGHGGIDHAAMGHTAKKEGAVDHSKMDHSKMDHSKMDHSKMDHSKMDHAAMGHATPSGPDPFYAPGSGLMPKAANGGKFLSYADLRAQNPLYDVRPPTREIEIGLTGNMERYSWSINGIKYSDAEPIRLTLGERVRFKFVNTTMMTHPMHLHGMWTMLDNGSGKWNPVKHVVSIAPGTTVYTEVEVDAVGEWAFHCHLMYHMATGMFRKVIVEEPPKKTAALQAGG